MREVSLAALALVLGGCGGAEPAPQAPVAREGPADQIFRVSRVWESHSEETGFRTPPSAIATFETRIASRLSFDANTSTARETLAFDSRFKLQDGSLFSCRVATELTVNVSFGEHADEAAVQVARAPLRLERQCDRPGFPEPVLEIPLATARFALRGDRLIAFAPPTERREYIPVD